MQIQRTGALVAALATLSLALVGCTGTEAPAEDSSSRQASEPTTTPAPGEDGQAPTGKTDLSKTTFAVSLQDAVDTAKSMFDGGLTEVDLDWDAGRYMYEVELVSATEQFEVRVDATTGETYGERAKPMEASEAAEKQASIIDLGTVVPLASAAKAALGVDGGGIESWSLEGNPQGPRYKMDIIGATVTDFEVTVDAISGLVLGTDD